MSKTALPIWLREAPAGRSTAISREKIATAALALADKQGFDAVSMRLLATKLGVGTMSLYHYVKTKNDLVALMDDALMAEILVDDLPKGWRAGLTAIARRTREVFIRHPWALVSMRGALPGPNGMRHFEQGLLALASTALKRDEKLELIAMVDDFVFGNALRAAEARPDAKTNKAFMAWARKLVDAGGFPQIASVFADAPPVPGDDLARFERGLGALLDGFEHRKR